MSSGVVMDVTCLGILVADIFASPIDSLPEPGELKPTNKCWLSVGGCAANTAVSLRRLNRSVAVMGMVGTDRFGDFVVDELGRHQIDTSQVKRSAHLPTSSTMILNIRGEDRRYIHSIGANADLRLTGDELPWIEKCRVLYVGGYLATPGISPGDLTKLFQSAQEKSVITVLDVAIPVGASVSLAHLEPVLLYTRYFLPNEDEARLLTGKTDVSGQLHCLTRLNPKCTVVITRGDRGSLANYGSSVIQTAAFPVDAVDESGAGDAFAAGFITGILEDWPLDYNLRFAGAIGASCTRAFGCHEGVASPGEAHSMIAEQSAQLQRPVVQAAEN